MHTPDATPVLAGDGIRCDFPVALMERAATTGFLAANQLLANWNLRGHDLWTVPLQGRQQANRFGWASPAASHPTLPIDSYMSNGAGIGAAMQDSARGMPAGSVAAAVVACTTVAAVLGLVGLGRESVWLDEAITARVGEMPASQFLQTITGREANSELLFSLLVRPWLAAAGNGPEALRAPSVAAFVAAVPAFYLLATKLFDRRVGLVAAALIER